MPTIELISIRCPRVPDLPRYDTFAYMAETKLHGHRALFQPVFDSLTGVIVHLANKDFESDQEGGWFAGDLMDWQDKLQVLVFLPDSLLDVRDLMERLLIASPARLIVFSTDYQFGGKRRESGEIGFAAFFDMHARRRLRFNTLYFVHPDVSDGAD